MKSFTILQNAQPKIEKSTILEAINETINVEIKGEPDKFVNKNIQVSGKEDLAKELDAFFKEQRGKTKKIVLDNLRKEHFHVLNLKKLGKDITFLTENLKRYDNKI